MTNGFSSAVSRLLRTLQRKHHDHLENDAKPAAAAFLTSSGNISPPKVVFLPSGFTRQVRHLVNYVTLLAKQRATTSTSTRRHAAVNKSLDRVATMLRERDTNDTATRAMPLNAAAELMVTVWECVLQCLEVSKSHSSPGSTPSNASTTAADRLSSCSSSSSTIDETTRLDLATRALLALLFQQKEFDFALMALGHGDCNAHQSDVTRKRSIHDGPRMDPQREEVVRVPMPMRTSRRGSVASKRAPLPRVMPTKRDVSSTSDAPLCQLMKKYLDLHQTTLRFLQDAVSPQTPDRSDDGHASDIFSDHALMVQLLAVSYVRVPVLRETILHAFQQVVKSSDGRRSRLQAQQRGRQQQDPNKANGTTASIPFVRSRSSTLMDEVNVSLFCWTQNLHPKCQASVAPYNRDGSWSKECLRVVVDMQDARFQRMVLAQLIHHFLKVAGDGEGIEWKGLPGAAVLKEMVLTMTESVFQLQLHAAEMSMLDKEEPLEGSSLQGADGLGRQSFSVSASEDWTVGFFVKQTMRMLGSNTPLIHDWMMTILHNTNYLIPQHVTLCLGYLSQLQTAFPAYFSNDYGVATGTGADATVLAHVFSLLLKSEHFEILRTTELFLLKHFTGFSMSLRESLVEAIAGEFKRLFLHWNRDVRFCFYHMVLYLTYPGNRLVLGAKSDELLMGAVAAQLFEIPGLVRKTSTAATKWDAFDTPLCELITYVNRTAKHQPRALASATAAGSTLVAPRSQQHHQVPATMMRTSMTLRPKPTMRGGMNARSNQRSMQTAGAPASYGTLTKYPSMPKLPTTPASAPASLAPPIVPEWIQQLPFSTVQRSVLEYRRHVETYFCAARMISVHEAVPPPALQAAKRDAATA